MKMMKKLCSVLLALLLLTTVMAVCSVPASALAETGSCGYNVTWRFDAGSGALTISGRGDMSSYTYGNSPFYTCDEIRTVTIESGVTAIGAYAFQDCHKLSGVTIPDTVKSIRQSAFIGCSRLEKITIPEGVTELGYGVFENAGLEEIDLPDSLTYIGAYAFYGTDLTSLTVPDNVTEIRGLAFASCSSMETVTLPRSVTKIGDLAFTDTPLKAVNYMGSREDWEKIDFGENVFSTWDSAARVYVPYDVRVNYDYDPENPIIDPEPEVCPWCGGEHSSFFQGIVGFFHRIFALILGARY